MKIYFAGSVCGGRADQELYLDIIKELQKYGTVLTEHIGRKELSSYGETRYTEDFILTRDVDWIKESDVIVAEVTQPSLGVGYELGVAESLGKKVYCLYRSQEGKRLSAMIRGNNKFIVKDYSSLDDAIKIIVELFKK